MPQRTSSAGQIVILNGAPRSGKSSIARIAVESFPGLWVNLGVDLQARMISSRHMPGIGLRPGGEHPEKEPVVQRLYSALYESIAAHSRLGIHVIVDIGHHNEYSQDLHILHDCAQRLEGLPAFFIGVRCSIEVIMARRAASPSAQGVHYLQASEHEPVPRPVQRWQTAVHDHDAYDFDVDTTSTTPEECAKAIFTFINRPICQPTFFQRQLKLQQI